MKTTKLLFFFFGMVLSLFLVGCVATPSRRPGPIVMGYVSPLVPRNVSEIQKIPSINWTYATGCALGIPYSRGGDMFRITLTGRGGEYITVLRTGNIVLSTSEEFVGNLSKLPGAVPGGTIDVVIDFYNLPGNGGAWITSHTLTLGLSDYRGSQSSRIYVYSYQIEGPGKVVRTHN